MTHENFVTYEQARILKDLGFDWKCISVYDEEKDFKIFKHFRNFNEEKEYYISAPTLSQVQKWLREVKNIVVLVTCNLDYKKGHEWYWFIDKDVNIEDPEHTYKTYEEALEAGINKALELLK